MIYLGTIASAGSDVVNNLSTAPRKASLDLATQALGRLNTVVEAKTGGTAGNSITVAAVGDGGLGDGVTIVELSSAVTIHYESGVSTVADVEATITSDATLIEVKTPGTAATILTNATDDFSAAALHNGLSAATPFDIPRGCSKLRLVPDATSMFAVAAADDSSFAPAAAAMFPLGGASSINDFDIGSGRVVAIRKTTSGVATTKVFGV